MQKKIIALAIAAAMAAPVAAMAEATVYGQANVAFEVVDNGDKTTPAPVGTAAPSKNNVSSNTSRLGFKGSEDLGNGMTAVFQMETKVNMDTGAATLFDRNTFAGVAGGFGTVVLGQHDTPYKMSTRDMDVFKDSIADNRSLMGLGDSANYVGNLDVRATDVLAYISPDFSGLTIAAAYIGETDNTLGAPAGSKASGMTVSANYGRDAFTVALGYIGVKQSTAVAAATDFDLTAMKIGGSYAMDAFKVNLVVEMPSAKVGVAGTKVEQTNIYASGTYAVSDAGKVKLAYTMAGELKAGGTAAKGSGASQMSLGYDHAMTKNTTLFAAYSSINNDTAAQYGFTSGGSTADTGAAVTADEDMSAISFGVRHSF